MTRAQYLAELNARLIALPGEERDSAMRYYAECFDEAGSENENGVAERLGTPAAVAAQLLGEEGRIPSGPRIRRKHGVLTWTLIVLGSPIWISLGAAALLVLLAVLITIFSVLLVLATLAVTPLIVGATLLLAGTFSAVIGVSVIFSSIPTMLWFAGMGLVAVSLGGLLFHPCLLALQRSLKLIFRVSAWIMKKLWRALRRL